LTNSPCSQGHVTIIFCQGHSKLMKNNISKWYPAGVISINFLELRLTIADTLSNGQRSPDLQIWLQGHIQIFSSDTCQSKGITKWADNTSQSWLKLIYFQASVHFGKIANLHN